MANQHRPRSRGSQAGTYQQPRRRNDDARRKEFIQCFGENYVDTILAKEKENYNSYIDALTRFVKGVQRDITTSQIRNVFSRIKNIRSEKYTELYTLRPKLAYVAGRAKEDQEGLKTLMLLLDELIQKVDSKDTLREFQNFFEAVIAYHKYYGGN